MADLFLLSVPTFQIILYFPCLVFRFFFFLGRHQVRYNHRCLRCLDCEGFFASNLFISFSFLYHLSRIGTHWWRSDHSLWELVLFFTVWVLGFKLFSQAWWQKPYLMNRLTSPALSCDEICISYGFGMYHEAQVEDKKLSASYSWVN